MRSVSLSILALRIVTSHWAHDRKISSPIHMLFLCCVLSACLFHLSHMGWHQGAFALKKPVVLLCNYPSGPGKKDIRVAFFFWSGNGWHYSCFVICFKVLLSGKSSDSCLMSIWGRGNCLATLGACMIKGILRLKQCADG